MDINNQKQTAGNGSTQIQGENISINVGIDEMRAREICKETYNLMKTALTQEATEEASKRVKCLEDKLIPKLIEYDKTLHFFKNPEFQFALRHAQISAASSTLQEDYEVLSELLLHQVKHNDDRGIKLTVNKAIDAVDKISESALCGLSCTYILSALIPQYNNPNALKLLDSIFGNVIKDCQLPTGSEWIEHLSLLDAIRVGIQNINPLKKFDDIFTRAIPQYFENGIEDNSEEMKNLKERLAQAAISLNNIFIPHPTKCGFHVLNLPKDKKLINPKLDVNQKLIIENMIDKYKNSNFDDDKLKRNYVSQVKSYSNLNKLRSWWDSINISFSITPVGVVLANAFAHGRDASIQKISF